MKADPRFSKSKAVVEFEFSHQFEARRTLESLLSLLNVPAITNVQILVCADAEKTEYKPK